MQESGSEEINVPTAPPPFNDPDSDAILRSKEPSVDFFIMRAFLSYASPVFKDMFSIPQGDKLTRGIRNDKPIIPLEEDPETLGLILKFCYPFWTQSSNLGDTTLEQLLKARTVAHKYQMDGVDNTIRRELVADRFLQAQPLRIYAIALSQRLEPETRLAAKATLRLPILGRQYYEELEYITGGAHHRLQEYHIKCAEVAKRVVTNFEWIEQHRSVWFECNSERTSISIIISRRRSVWVMAKWWWDYMLECAGLLAERPSGTTVLDPRLIDGALLKAIGCPSCNQRAPTELRAFAQEFAAQVDKATAEVQLEVKLMADT
ncbi:hypothetical protein H0H92_005408 [Tricholoma furcatifolium]|nr:hypothetical protein H0H92_005408 [Tricholoma furcatifolium]